MEPKRASPASQMLEMLSRAKRSGVPWAQAWARALHGDVCSAYESLRHPKPDDFRVLPSGAPEVEISEGAARCGGCVHREEQRCALYDRAIYSGVLWPHRTDDRRQWKDTIKETREAWRESYENEPPRVSSSMVALAAARREASVDVVRVSGGKLLA